VNILIDTHIFLWLLYDSKQIKKNHYEILQDTNNNLYISSLSIAEIMIKKSTGKLNVEFDLNYALDMFDMKLIDFDAGSALLLGTLPLHHRDPFDRMIISQAISNKYKIMSVDRKFKLYNCELL
jgi:PIN domain nuclease of toxin-antitoxin system